MMTDEELAVVLDAVGRCRMLVGTFAVQPCVLEPPLTAVLDAVPKLIAEVARLTEQNEGLYTAVQIATTENGRLQSRLDAALAEIRRLGH